MLSEKFSNDRYIHVGGKFKKNVQILWRAKKCTQRGCLPGGKQQKINK